MGIMPGCIIPGCIIGAVIIPGGGGGGGIGAEIFPTRLIIIQEPYKNQWIAWVRAKARRFFAQSIA
jgi:hypothetical protein